MVSFHPAEQAQPKAETKSGRLMNGLETGASSTSSREGRSEGGMRVAVGSRDERSTLNVQLSTLK